MDSLVYIPRYGVSRRKSELVFGFIAEEELLRHISLEVISVHTGFEGYEIDIPFHLCINVRDAMVTSMVYLGRFK